MNQLQIFNNEEFGQVRTITRDNDVWFIGKDICDILKYQNGSRDINRHVDEEDRIKEMVAQYQNGTLVKTQTILINESGLYSLVFSSKLPTAKRFKHWVTSEVLPSIRKNGHYKVETNNKNEEAELLNAKARVAELWLKLGDRTNIKEYKQITDSYASEVLAGKRVLPLPAVIQKTYSAGEIGAILGVSAQKIGRLANSNNLKTEEYGKFFYDKAKNSNKEVETFRYFDSAIEKFKTLIA